MSRRSSPTSSRPRTPLSIDLSSIPRLEQPTPPSNTLLITNLQDPEIFRPDNLQTIKDLINSSAPVHSWAPLKSFRRILVSFFDEASAIRIRQILDGEAIIGERVKVYFGQPTSIQPKDGHLNLPDAGKLFFISPPPSPPFGWEMRAEDAPNKQVHPEDLAEALAKLHHQPRTELPVSPIDSDERRPRSGSTTIYNPKDHGDSPHLPAIAVEDFTGDQKTFTPLGLHKPIKANTARPSVELMDER
ncbi:MAG: hypothetical protein M1818_005064 [Claussenomyces sp. TS43310]|nr:MAG: hypothetical protein M1818_005064 [Claussenomyces sp. TS43310]